MSRRPAATRSERRLGGATTSERGGRTSIVIRYIVRFEWSPRKAAANLKKHGVSFEEAKTAFDDELGAYYPDALHDGRFILIGYSRQMRLLYVVYAEATVEAIRIISARKATKREKAHYEDD